MRIQDWEANIFHQTMSHISGCADREGSVRFDFYYFLEEGLRDEREIFSARDRYGPIVSEMESRNQRLV